MVSIFNTVLYQFFYTKEMFTMHLNFNMFFTSFQVHGKPSEFFFNEKGEFTVQNCWGAGVLHRHFPLKWCSEFIQG